MARHSLFILLALLIFLSGCGLLWDSSSDPQQAPIAAGDSSTVSKNEGADVAIKPLRLPDGKEQSDIEIILEAPLEPIDGFIIQYGSSPNQLDKTKRVELYELQRVSGTQNTAPRYRFLLRSIPNNQKVFFTVASFRGGFYSAPSSVVEVK